MAKMTLQAFLDKLNLALNNKTYYATGAFGAPMNETMRVRYAQNTPFLSTVAADPSRFLFDCCGLLKAVLSADPTQGWRADSSLVYGGTWVHKVNGNNVYNDMNVPDYNETSMFNACENISTDFTKIKPGAAVWQPGHIGVYIGDGFCIESTPAFRTGGGVIKSALGDANPGYPYRRTGAYKWVKYGFLPWVDYGSSPEPVKPYKYNGVDVSSSSGSIDFAQLKNGVDFVLSRTWLGKPMSSQATGDYDQRAFANWQGCIDAGIPIHPYMTTYAQNDSDVREECRSIIWWFNNQPLNTPKHVAWIELFNQGGGYPRDWSTYTAQQMLDRFKLYKSLLAAAGIEMGIITGKDRYWTERLSDPWYDANVYKMVVSDQDPKDDASWNRSFTIWQITTLGSVPGISTSVKLDHTDVNLWGAEPEPPGPGPDPEPTPDPPAPTEEVDELHAQLYSFRGERDVINKLAAGTDIVSLWYGRIKPFNLVQALSFSFTLGKYYPANYCRFKIGGLQYFANVEVRTLANGIYQYICDIDAGTTGYYQGMYDDQYAEFLYSPNGVKLWKDSRVPVESEITIDSHVGSNDDLDDVQVTVVSCWPGMHRDPDPTFTRNSSQNFGVNVYISKTLDKIQDLVHSLTDSDANKYIPSIIKSYYIHNFPFDELYRRLDQAIGYPYSNDYYLFSCPSSEFGSFITTSSYDSKRIGEGYANKDITINIPKTFNNFHQDFEISDVSRDMINGKWHIYIPDVGIIDFRLSDILDISSYSSSKVKIGYSLYYDFAGGNILAKLRVNETIVNAYRIEGCVRELFPIMYNGNVNGYINMVSSATGTVAGFLGMAVGAYTQNPVLMNMGTNAMLTQGMKTAQQIEDIYRSPTSIKGNLGGSCDHACDQVPFYWVEYHKEIYGSTFSSEFGYPDGQTKKIKSSMTTAGYYQTGDNTHVRAAGYNDRIVEEARRALQGGVRIV